MLPASDASPLTPVEGGALHCRDSALALRNLSVVGNEAASSVGTRGLGGGLAAHDCTGDL